MAFAKPYQITTWEHTIILKLLGRNIDYKAPVTILMILWPFAKPYQIIDLDNNFFLIQFSLEVDYMTSLMGGHDGFWSLPYNVAIYIKILSFTQMNHKSSDMD